MLGNLLNFNYCFTYISLQNPSISFQEKSFAILFPSHSLQASLAETIRTFRQFVMLRISFNSAAISLHNRVLRNKSYCAITLWKELAGSSKIISNARSTQRTARIRACISKWRLFLVMKNEMLSNAGFHAANISKRRCFSEMKRMFFAARDAHSQLDYLLLAGKAQLDALRLATVWRAARALQAALRLERMHDYNRSKSTIQQWRLLAVAAQRRKNLLTRAFITKLKGNTLNSNTIRRFQLRKAFKRFAARISHSLKNHPKQSHVASPFRSLEMINIWRRDAATKVILCGVIMLFCKHQM